MPLCAYNIEISRYANSHFENPQSNFFECPEYMGPLLLYSHNRLRVAVDRFKLRVNTMLTPMSLTRRRMRYQPSCKAVSGLSSVSAALA
jgi:hypothetical protein